MFSREQIDVLYYLVEKGVTTEEAVKAFLKAKLAEVGLTEPTPPAPETPAEPAPPAPEAAPAA